MPAWFTLLLGLLLPLLFWLFHFMGWPYWPIGALLLPLAWQRRALLSGAIWPGIAAALLGAFALYAKSANAVRLYPVLVNLSLLIVFAGSLRSGMPIIEKIARLREPQLPPAGIAYTRKVTQAWCVFFIGNGTLALITVLVGNEQIWLLYNGFIAYLLMGAMFAGEWLLRRRMRQRA